MAASVSHGARSYDKGCRCDVCRAANTERKRLARTRARAKALLSVVPEPPAGGLDVPGVLVGSAGPIETAARRALAGKDGPADELRRQVAFAAARVMDNQSVPQFFKSAADVLERNAAALLAVEEEDGDAAVLREVLGSFGARGGS